MATVVIPLAPGPLVELDLGDIAVVRAPFTVDGVATDPTAVTWQVWEPGDDDAPTAPTSGATHPGVGDYRLAVPVTAAGRWWVKATGTGADAGAEVVGFFARSDPPR